MPSITRKEAMMTHDEREHARAHIQTAQLALATALVWLDVDPRMARNYALEAAREIESAKDDLPERGYGE